MAAVLEYQSDPDRPRDTHAEIPAAIDAAYLRDNAPVSAETGLKPIQRLTSDKRIERINSESDSKTILRYSSQFARTFIRSDYNFCAAKVAVARGGKVKAVESALRDASEWLTKTDEWLGRHYARPIEPPYETIELVITRPLAGFLVRCLTQYDRVFIKSLAVMLAEKISADDRARILANAEKRIKHIAFVCTPDNDQYDADGARRDK